MMNEWTACNMFRQTHAACSKCLLGVNLWVWDWCITGTKHKSKMQTEWNPETWNAEITVELQSWIPWWSSIDFVCLLHFEYVDHYILGFFFGWPPKGSTPQQPQQPGLLHAGANLLRFPGPLKKTGEGNRPAMPPNLPWSLMKNQEQLPLKILIDHLARNNYGVLTIKIVTNICQMQVDYVRLKIADPHSSHRVDPIVQQKLVPATPAQNSTPALSMEVEHNYLFIYSFIYIYIY